jgi:hypothetical protein
MTDPEQITQLLDDNRELADTLEAVLCYGNFQNLPEIKVVAMKLLAKYRHANPTAHLDGPVEKRVPPQ